ncbi:hypothetical protein [Oceanisphaera sp. KMM 10153]|uniref:hypothetical protein n=1 Tax=Oceanisphaera submarina TaxID=3390193 RepID=UPI003975DC28
MSMIKLSFVSMAAVCVLTSFSAHAINKNYAKKLEQSGCTQVTEAQGCDINKTKAENAKAGFVTASQEAPVHAPRYKDLAGKDSISSLDVMTERGFKNVDSLESGNTQYGIYYHAHSHLCVQLTMAEGKVIAADDIQSHPQCR